VLDSPARQVLDPGFVGRFFADFLQQEVVEKDSKKIEKDFYYF
jgi:hypothetical protein